MLSFEMKLSAVFNFYTICVQVGFANLYADCIEVILTSTQVVSMLDFYFCPGWTEVGFLTSNQVGWK